MMDTPPIQKQLCFYYLEVSIAGNGFTKSANGQIVHGYVILVGKKIKIQDGTELWEVDNYDIK